MKKQLLLAAAMLAVAVPSATLASNPIQITFNAGSSDLGTTTVFEDFNSYATGSTQGGGGKIFATSVTNTAARPAFGADGKFLAVLKNKTYDISFAGLVQVFSVQLGSLDSFNTLTLFFQDGTNQVLSGAGIIGATSPLANDGSQTSINTNGRVFYDARGYKNGALIGASFSSGENSFEFDNLASAAPEPATWGMMILAAGMAGSSLRRRRRAASAAAAAA